jgi:hypothetical protein
MTYNEIFTEWIYFGKEKCHFSPKEYFFRIFFYISIQILPEISFLKEFSKMWDLYVCMSFVMVSHLGILYECYIWIFFFTMFDVT